MDTYTRAAVSVLSDDGSDPATAYRTSIRNLAAFCNTYGFIWRGSGTLASRPAFGRPGSVWRSTDKASGILDFDTGTAWMEIGYQPPADPAAGTAGLRTLGGGAQQAAPGNHTHADAGAAPHILLAADQLAGSSGLVIIGTTTLLPSSRYLLTCAAPACFNNGAVVTFTAGGTGCTPRFAQGRAGRDYTFSSADGAAGFPTSADGGSAASGSWTLWVDTSAGSNKTLTFTAIGSSAMQVRAGTYLVAQKVA